MANVNDPVVEKISFNKNGLRLLDERNEQLLLDYPTVYIIYAENKDSYSVYVGETNNIKQRTREHFQEMRYAKRSKMFVVGHEHFNKSLTLDIENKLMLYMTGSKAVKNLSNKRANPQYKYFPVEEMNAIFSKIWRQLHRENNQLFPVEKVIEENALFKASPFHKLTEEQMNAEITILDHIKQALNEEKENQLILVEGSAGSGKTVLLSSLFYLLSGQDEEFKGKSAYMLVNHDQQVKVYNNIAKKLGIQKKFDEKVMKPTKFINNFTDKADIALIDEAHLLWTQGKQSYQGKNQLNDIMDRAKITIAVLDPHQMLRTQQYIEGQTLKKLENRAKKNGHLIKLSNQLRMNAAKDTVKWIKMLVYGNRITNLPKDDKDYELKIFKSPGEMYKAIKEKNRDQSKGLSRMLATFDWEFKEKRDKNHDLYQVTVEDFSLPWNLQTKSKDKNLSWAERPETINEVGSTYTIQGFDLNYSGVIIGPSVKYRDGKIVYDPNASANKNAVSNRTLSDGSKVKVYNQLLPNELNVLLTRGVNGLYIYAVDDELRKALLAAQNQEIQN
ncbi:DUF2075 domain-containing protein [Pediococcus acidilactici]|uniref:DUF2075 domain-containing protein n=1 Tax=Pediococcus acidilactici TaxID=1254 RepID=UPI0019522CD5|nr:DUF2075 domain-containing protein [Pediococcus acidilactici]MBM6586078.1 DUF2075 domain-containing protein [Pediococcus acidilactici]